MLVKKITAAVHIDSETESTIHTITSLKYAAPAHCHDYYEFFLITKGKCIHKVNKGEQHLFEGALVFVRPDDMHWYEYNGNTDCEFINMACTSKVIEDAFCYLREESYIKKLVDVKLPPFIMLSHIEKENLINHCERVKVLATTNKYLARIQLRSVIIEILTQYFPIIQNNIEEFIPLWLEILFTKMQKKENFTEGLEKMYELSGKSVGHLNRVLKRYFKTTPTSYINQLRLNYAKSLLLTTNLNIIDVSMEAGFENLSHFYHLFKQNFNTTPSVLKHMIKSSETAE